MSDITIHDPNWTDHVMSQLRDNEKIKTGRPDFPFAPKVNGLRRIAEKIIGRIIAYQVRVVSAPSETNNRATVTAQITFELPNNREFYVEDAADCWAGNTSDPYCRHPVGTATSMAEGRALRKALHLNILTMEELRNPDETSLVAIQVEQEYRNKATEHQVSIIKSMLTEHQLDLLDFIPENKTLETLSKDEAGSVICAIRNRNKGKKEKK